KAMKRIKIPSQIITILNNILEERSNKVITFHGLTNSYEVHDGIDQGDAISPLLWRIYYDPLLDAIKKSDLGYTMSTNCYENVGSTAISQIQQRIYATVYMDDTVWVANNKYNLQKMLNITQEFRNIVDIAINPSKSQVIHINPKSEEKNSPIIMNEQAVIPVGKNEPVRYLGVWLTQSGKKTF